MVRKLVVGVLMLALVMPVYAQTNTTSSSMGPRQQLATIIFAGLAGAVLGLSTLSFYGRPQEKLSNIAVGFAVGIITGAVYTTYKAATDPYERYQGVFIDESEKLLPGYTELGDEQLVAGNETELGFTPKLQWNFEF